MRLFLFAFCFLTLTLKAQTFYFQEVSVAEGLSSEKVYTLFEDQDHFIWLGTKFGVSKYDGLKVVNYSVADGLANGGVKSIYQDRFGSLFFGHYEGGFSRYKEGFTSYDSLVGLGHVYDILEFQNELWVITLGAGAFRFSLNIDGSDWDFSQPVQFLGKDGLSDRVYDIAQLSTGELIFVTDAGLKQYHGQSEAFINYKDEIVPAYFQITCLLESSKGLIYFGTHNGGLYILNPKTDQISFRDEKSGLSHNFIMDIKEDQTGRIWMATFGSGLNMLDGDDIHIFDAQKGFFEARVQSLLVNYQGMLLAGTDASGLQIFKGFQFVNYDRLPEVESNTVYDIVINGENLFLATDLGLIHNVLRQKGEKQIDFVENLIPTMSPRFLLTDGDRGLWFATELDGLWYYDFRQKNHQSITELAPYFRLNKITSLAKDHLNRLWIGTIDGLLMFDPKTKTVERLSQENGILKNDISAVQTTLSKIWIGSRQSRAGVNYIQGNKIYKLELPVVLTPTAFYEAEDELWIGTANQGIFVVKADTISAVYTINEGLQSNHIAFIARDPNGRMWVGSQNGLSLKLENNSDRWIGYSKAQGFGGLDCMLGAYDFDPKGNLWIGASRGIMLNQTHQISKYEGPLKPVIQTMLVDGQKRSLASDIDLAYHENDIQFEISAVELFAPDQLKIRYRIAGLNQRWETLGEQRKMPLFALQSGAYSLELSIEDAWGKIYELDQPLQWTINPPWYKTRWALVSAFLLVIAITYGYIKYREQNLKREKRILEQKIAERTHEVVIKNKQLEQKNLDITDSLHYASGIQQAVLPEADELSPYGFVFYQPKDIVSGDFYFISKSAQAIYVCAADCTGHGVPGALLSIMGVNMMDGILRRNPEISPQGFLDLLNTEVANTLRQDELHGVNDGMDLALVKIDIQTKTLEYAGAYNSLYLFRNSELMEYKADRFSIGSKKDRGGKSYTNHLIDFQWGDRIYLFSDGLADQFGGVQGKKLKSSGLKRLLLNAQKYTIQQQKQFIVEFMEDWKIKEDQIDDMLMMGLELSDQLVNLINHD